MTQGARPSTSPPPSAAILFDVTDLDRSCEFYASTLGFRVVGEDRTGLPFTMRTLRSERYPAVQLTLRQTYRRPVVGSAPGGIIHLGLRDTRLAESAKALDGRVRWSQPSRNEPAAPGTVEFLDPDGYIIRLFE